MQNVWLIEGKCEAEARVIIRHASVACELYK